MTSTIIVSVLALVVFVLSFFLLRSANRREKELQKEIAETRKAAVELWRDEEEQVEAKVTEVSAQLELDMNEVSRRASEARAQVDEQSRKLPDAGWDEFVFKKERP